MRLRYLHIPELPPLHNIEITFGHEPILGRACTIHFIAGVNGSGKSRLLRALAEIFLSLSESEVPPFPVTIAYDLGRNLPGQEASQSLCTIYYRYTGRGKGSSFMVILNHISVYEEVDWQHFHRFDWKNPNDTALPQRYHRRRCLFGDTIAEVKSYLPTYVLAYTSGSPHEWETVFAPPLRNLEESIELPRVEQDPEERRRMERPPKWNSHKEAEYNQRLQQEGDHTIKSIAEWEGLPRRSQTEGEELLPGKNLFPGNDVLPGGPQPGIGIFIQPEMLKLVVCAVALSQVLAEFKKYPTESERAAFEQKIEDALEKKMYMDGMRSIFNAVDWLWPVSIGLQIAFRTERLRTLRREASLLRKLYLVASKVIRGSDPAESRTLYFDLARLVQVLDDPDKPSKSTLEALANILGGADTQAFDIFKQLLELQRQNILEDVIIALKKRKVGGALLYDQLSDGERVLLGRMALFHLLKGTDDTLIVLDEPETHFNDIWKREVVDMIDSALHNDTSEIVLTTHSSIALTDVFDTEISLLKKNPRDASVYAIKPKVRSFGASPDDILHEFFDAPDSVGQRASEFLDLMLIATAHWQQVQDILGEDSRKRAVALEQLKQFLREQSNTAITDQSDDDLNNYLLNTLQAVSTYTQQKRDRVSAENVLDVLQERLGSGYYQFEFRRRLRALRKDSNAASN